MSEREREAGAEAAVGQCVGFGVELGAQMELLLSIKELGLSIEPFK